MAHADPEPRPCCCVSRDHLELLGKGSPANSCGAHQVSPEAAVKNQQSSGTVCWGREAVPTPGAGGAREGAVDGRLLLVGPAVDPDVGRLQRWGGPGRSHRPQTLGEVREQRPPSGFPCRPSKPSLELCHLGLTARGWPVVTCTGSGAVSRAASSGPRGQTSGSSPPKGPSVSCFP